MRNGITLPFTSGEFMQVFSRYHDAVGVAPLIAFAMGVLAVRVCFRRPAGSARVVSLILAALWFWIGAVYHFRFFLEINPAALIFGVMFILQGALFLLDGVIRERIRFEPRATSSAARLIGAVVIGHALVGYPLLGLLVGHSYPAAPTFGLPCPTVIFTLGLLIWARHTSPLYHSIIPVAWAVIGTTAAAQLGMWEDFGLLAAALALLTMLVRSRQSPAAATLG